MSQISWVLNFTSLCPASRPNLSDPVTYKRTREPAACSRHSEQAFPGTLRILNATSRFLGSTTPSSVSLQKGRRSDYIYSSKWAGRRNTGVHGAGGCSGETQGVFYGAAQTTVAPGKWSWASTGLWAASTDGVKESPGQCQGQVGCIQIDPLLSALLHPVPPKGRDTFH